MILPREYSIEEEVAIPVASEKRAEYFAANAELAEKENEIKQLKNSMMDKECIIYLLQEKIESLEKEKYGKYFK